jgi:hypothetical protein
VTAAWLFMLGSWAAIAACAIAFYVMAARRPMSED